MDDNRLDDKFQAISERLSSINVILARNTESLEQHMARTKASEARIFSLEEETKEMREESDDRYRLVLAEIKESFLPVNKHIAFVSGALKAFMLIGAIIVALHELGILQKLF